MYMVENKLMLHSMVEILEEIHFRKKLVINLKIMDLQLL
jgi:hypothetical protein